jgi:hypothetical protein
MVVEEKPLITVVPFARAFKTSGVLINRSSVAAL